ncbi:hypothetical protein SAZ11_31150 [Streptomyces sp. FXJ1.4098]|uniref:hypothetical protein n=1 Tax=Streptomyces sp. NPDC020845 TaxID=3365096 RepID=UPI00299B91F6|nr:hypothetical protein [Streptomyces sp. FXJ1.4098]
MFDQEVEIMPFGGRSRAQIVLEGPLHAVLEGPVRVVLEGPVREIDRVRRGLTQ